MKWYFERCIRRSSSFQGFASTWLFTEIRKINCKLGSIQIYVNSSVDLFKEGVYEKALKKHSAEDEVNLEIFIVFGQWDSGAHRLSRTSSFYNER